MKNYSIDKLKNANWKFYITFINLHWKLNISMRNKETYKRYIFLFNWVLLPYLKKVDKLMLLNYTQGWNMSLPKIIWSKIDEAPALATYSLLPIVNAFTKSAGGWCCDKRYLTGRAKVLASMGIGLKDNFGAKAWGRSLYFQTKDGKLFIKGFPN